MTRSPLVSVVIPMYNAERWITETIESVLTQSCVETEAVVVDDGSTDGSLAAARRLAGARVRVLAQPKTGANAARNRGIEAARGAFIQFLDGDDLLHPEKIATQLERLRSEPAGRVASGAWARFVADPAEAKFSPEPVWADLSPVDWLVVSWCGGGMMPSSAWLTPRAIVDRVGPWDVTLRRNQDGEYFTRVLLASSGVAFCADARSYYRSNIEGSVSRRAQADARDSLLRSIVVGGERLLAVEDSPRTRAALAAQLQRFIYEAYPDNPELVERAERLLRETGPASVPPPSGGVVFRAASRLAGWKAAKRLQRWAQRSR